VQKLRSRLPIILSATALIVAVFGATRVDHPGVPEGDVVDPLPLDLG